MTAKCHLTKQYTSSIPFDCYFWFMLQIPYCRCRCLTCSPSEPTARTPSHCGQLNMMYQVKKQTMHHSRLLLRSRTTIQKVCTAHVARYIHCVAAAAVAIYCYCSHSQCQRKVSIHNEPAMQHLLPVRLPSQNAVTRMKLLRPSTQPAASS